MSLLVCSQDGEVKMIEFSEGEIGTPTSSDEMQLMLRAKYGDVLTCQVTSIIENPDHFMADDDFDLPPVHPKTQTKKSKEEDMEEEVLSTSEDEDDDSEDEDDDENGAQSESIGSDESGTENEEDIDDEEDDDDEDDDEEDDDSDAEEIDLENEAMGNASRPSSSSQGIFSCSSPAPSITESLQAVRKMQDGRRRITPIFVGRSHSFFFFF